MTATAVIDTPSISEAIELARILSATRIYQTQMICTMFLFIIPAVAVAFCTAWIGNNFMQCAARQPEQRDFLLGQWPMIASLADAGAIFSVMAAFLFIYAHPVTDKLIL